MSDAVFKVNWKYETNITIVVAESVRTGLVDKSFGPLYDELLEARDESRLFLRDGVQR